MLALFFAFHAAHACGGFFCNAGATRIDQAGEHLLFASDGEQIEMHVEVDYVGEASEFAWIVPTPEPPELFLSSTALFDGLRAATARAFQGRTSVEGECYQPPMLGCAEFAFSDVGSVSGAPLVEVSQQSRVGAFDTVTLRADTSSELIAWLQANDYDLPTGLHTALAPYVADGSWFVALRLASDLPAGTLQPIGMRYPGAHPRIPIQLTAVAATPDMPIVAWFLADGEAIPSNYVRVQPNLFRLNFDGSVGLSYEDLVTAAVNEAGGQAWVTEAVLPTDELGLSLYDALAAERALTVLSTPADPQVFANRLRDLRGELRTAAGGNARSTSAIDQALAECIRLPDGASFTSINFWSNPWYYEDLWPELAFDAEHCADRIDAWLLAPQRRAQALLERHPTFTRLFTTLSPTEMTIDPEFSFVPAAGRTHPTSVVEQVTECSPTRQFSGAPRRLHIDEQTLPLPSSEWLRHKGLSTSAWIAQADLPAAQTIEQLTDDGRMERIVDNQAAIDFALADLIAGVPVGDGQSGCSFTPRHGAGTGLVLLMIGVPLRRRRAAR
jgi:hypothetical protein